MSSEQTVRVLDNPDEGRYDIFEGDDLAGFTVYRAHGDTWSFVHTEIEPAYEGKGYGTILVRGAMDDMLKRQISVLPFCPFVQSFIAHHKDQYLQLVPTDSRSRFEM